MKQSIYLSLFAVFMVMLGLVALTYGLERQERYECNKWQAEASKLHGYYMTDWQKSQCSHYEN